MANFLYCKGYCGNREDYSTIKIFLKQLTEINSLNKYTILQCVVKLLFFRQKYLFVF